MATANVTAIRNGLNTALATAIGRHYADEPDRVDPPCAVVYLDNPAVEYHTTLGHTGGCVLHFLVRVYAGRADGKRAQQTIDPYLNPSGTSSILAALESDASLGGTVDSLVVEDAVDYGLYTVAGLPYFGATWKIQAICSNDG